MRIPRQEETNKALESTICHPGPEVSKSDITLFLWSRFVMINHNDGNMDWFL